MNTEKENEKPLTRKDVIEIVEDAIDRLAGMIQREFISIRNTMSNMTTKEDLNALESRLSERLDIVENIHQGNHENRITKLEDDSRIIKTKLKIGISRA
jgi:hypothetical protein